MSNRHPSLGYETLTARADGKPQFVARLTCRCGAHVDQTIVGNHNPEAVVKRFRGMGWEADIQTARLARCPECIEAREKPKKEIVVQQTVNATPNKIATPPAITGEQRAKIRGLLDAHFDDAAGRYLDGYSDQRIGTEANAPWATVKEIREVGYGPIRGDAAVDELKAVVADIKKLLASLEPKIEACEKRLGLR